MEVHSKLRLIEPSHQFTGSFVKENQCTICATSHFARNLIKVVCFFSVKKSSSDLMGINPVKSGDLSYLDDVYILLRRS